MDGGGDHCCTAGGFTVGFGENMVVGGENGLGAKRSEPARVDFTCGGGYYTRGGTSVGELRGFCSWFGQGGCWLCYDNLPSVLWSAAGTGGTAGSGGIIRYSKDAHIQAFNGNRITNTNFDYNQKCFEYDKNGTLTNEPANVITFINDVDKKIIPSKIFIQDGIRRAVYDYLCYMPEDRKEKYHIIDNDDNLVIENTSASGLVKNVRIIEEKLDMTYSQQGIGSGAGYIELDNGTFEKFD